MAQREFIEEVRASLAGFGEHRLARMVQKMARLLSAELYQKDIHFISELLQNAEDNAYDPAVVPSVKIILTKTDITGTKAPATLLLFNNEVGFSKRNIEALCGAGDSTKEGKRAEGYIGEKGIGFKSVFLVTKQPHIISNGFRIRFNENDPLGYISPEWVETDMRKALASIYGDTLPATTLILPLRPEKVDEVAEQLMKISAESLLFLSKISKLSIHDKYSSPPVELVLSKCMEMRSEKRDGTVTSIVRLSSTIDEETMDSDYYMFKQRFDVPEEARDERREGIKQWTIELAFPVQDRIFDTGDVFSFLPMDLSSGLPFLINADFLLVSSRETMLFDNAWNQGIFNRIPLIYFNAFNHLFKSEAFGSKDVPSLALSAMYKYVPIEACSLSCFEVLRKEILAMLRKREVILCASDIGRPPPNGRLCVPALARQIHPSFRALIQTAPSVPSFLNKKQAGHIVDESLQNNYSEILSALEVRHMSVEEYCSCLDHPSWILSLSTASYVSLLHFLALAPQSRLTLNTLKLIRYIGDDGELKLTSVNDSTSMYWWSDPRQTPFLVKWILRFQRWLSLNFIPADISEEIKTSSSVDTKAWMEGYCGVKELTVAAFTMQVISEARKTTDPALVILATQFLFDRYKDPQQGIQKHEHLDTLPLVDYKGNIVTTGNVVYPGYRQKPVLLPGSASKWPLLLPGDDWSSHVIKLSDKYMEPETVELSNYEVFTFFLRKNFKAVDILELIPLKDQELPACSRIRGNRKATILLLHWIYRHEITNTCNLYSSISTAPWVTTDQGYRSPKQSFWPTAEVCEFLEPGDVPFVNFKFKSERLRERYVETLVKLGVVGNLKTGYSIVHAALKQLESESPESVDQAKLFRFWKYLCKVKPNNKDITKVLVTARGEDSPACWIPVEDCVIHDNEGLFEQIDVVAVDQFYDQSVLELLKAAGVAERASANMFCDLWLFWTTNREKVDVSLCELVWRELVASYFSSHTEKFWKSFLEKGAVPSRRAFGRDTKTVKLLPPSKTAIVDQLELERIFKDVRPCPWVVWYPSSQTIKLQQLNKLYSTMGVKKITELAESKTTLKVGARRRISYNANVYLTENLFRAILSYLAAHFDVRQRHELLWPILRLSEVKVNAPLTVEWKLGINRQKYQAASTSLVFWDKSKGELQYVVPETEEDVSVDFAQQFANVIANGLLFEHRELITGLEDLLAWLALKGFDRQEVDSMLIKKNLRLYTEDEEFICSGDFIESEEPPRKLLRIE